MQSNQKDLDEIVAEFRKTKCQRAFTLIYKRLRGSLYQYVLPLCRFQHDVTEDVVQEAFVKAFRYIDQFNAKFKFTTWLWKIAQNHACYEMIRRDREARRVRCFDDIRGTTGKWKHATAEDFYARCEYSDALVEQEEEEYRTMFVGKVKEAIEMLPKKYREIVQDREFSNMSYEELAQAYDLKKNTIRARIRRGREQVRFQMADYVHPDLY